MFVTVSGEDASEKPETDDEGIEQDSGDGTDDGAVSKVPPFSFDSGPLYAIITKVIEVSKTGAALIRPQFARLIYFLRTLAPPDAGVCTKRYTAEKERCWSVYTITPARIVKLLCARKKKIHLIFNLLLEFLSFLPDFEANLFHHHSNS